jgi:hypothetical protein
MNRKVPLLLLFALAVAYAAWPAWAAWQLRAALKARDFAALETKVDWPTLRANLKDTLAAALTDDDKTAASGRLRKALKRTLGPAVANAVIDIAVTPRTLARLIAGRDLFVAREADAQRPQASERADGASADDPMPPRRLRWAFFETPRRFRIEIADRRQPGRRIVTVLELQGLAWKLVNVYYRSEVQPTAARGGET